MLQKPKTIMLTLDIEGWAPREDRFDEVSAICLRKVLDLMEQENFRGIFFVTATVAEQLQEYPDLVEMLCCQRIGYHSAAHNVQPGIISLTDVPSYEKAVELSLERETSSMNSTNGKVEGRGGLLALKATFPKNEIDCFRAPYLGWSPPHLEALKKLGIKYDFSAQIADYPVYFKEIVFYPPPVAIDSSEFTFVQRQQDHFLVKPLTSILLQKNLTVLSLHPSALLVKNCFDMTRCRPRGKYMIKFSLSMIKLLFKRIRLLQALNLVKVTNSLVTDYEPIDEEGINVRQIYQKSVKTPMELFNCRPQYVFSHFLRFFNSKERL